MTWALVVVAGALGTAARYSIGLLVGPRELPWATLGINVSGSFLIGLALTVGAERLSPPVTTALAVGFLGAFTTYSTFSYEAFTLAKTSQMPSALLYIAVSVAMGWGAAALGYGFGSSLAR